jgi:hypothetical protein
MPRAPTALLNDTPGGNLSSFCRLKGGPAGWVDGLITM